MKKTVVMIFAAVMILTMVLAGCAKQGSAQGSETITLTFWHSLGASISGPIIKDFIAQYMEDHPNIKIVEESVPESDYQTRKLKVAVTNGSQGDIFHSYGAGYSRPFVEAGAALALDEYLEKDRTYDRMQDGVLEYLTYNGKVYGLPLTKWAGVLFCNTDLFSQYGVSYPENWEQLIAAVKTFRSAGLTPMAMGGRDSWAIALLQNALAVRTAGADYCNKAIIGENSLDTPEIAQSISLLQELVEAGAFDPGVLGLSYEEASMEFNLGHIPMYFNGSWLAGEVESPDNLVQGKIKPIPLPVVSGGKGDKNQFLGGATACYMINSKTKYPDEAVAFAIALAEYQAREAYIAGDDVTCWKSNVDESEVNTVLLEINKLTANATGYVLAWDTFLVGTAIDAHYDLVQQALGRAVTPAEFARKMQAANEASLLEQAGSN